MNDGVWLGSDVLPLTPQERATTDLLMWAVAAARIPLPPSLTGSSCISGYIESLNAGTGAWRALLADHLKVTEHRRGLLALLAATSNAVLPQDAGWEGRVVQRANGVLDILEVDISAQDITAGLHDTVSALKESAQTKTVRRSIGIGKMAAGFLAGAHGQFWAIKHIEKAGDYVANLVGSGDEELDRLAQLLVASELLAHTGDHTSVKAIASAIEKDRTETVIRVNGLNDALVRLEPGPGGEKDRLTAQLRPLEQRKRLLTAARDSIGQV